MRTIKKHISRGKAVTVFRTFQNGSRRPAPLSIALADVMRPPLSACELRSKIDRGQEE